MMNRIYVEQSSSLGLPIAHANLQRFLRIRLEELQRFIDGIYATYTQLQPQWVPNIREHDVVLAIAGLKYNPEELSQQWIGASLLFLFSN